MAHRMFKLLPGLAATFLAATACSQTLPAPSGMPAFDASGLEGSPAPTTSAQNGVSILPAPSEAESIGAPSMTGEPHGPPPGPTGYQPFLPESLRNADAFCLPDLGPAITESTGTWLRRGLWYADLDAVVMARTWNSFDTPLMEEFDALPTQLTNSTIQVLTINNTIRSQVATLGESSPGYDGTARLALGRFLFRDQRNRDHTAEMVVFGGAELTESVAAEAQLVDPLDGLFFVGSPASLNAAGDQRGLHVTRGIDNSQPFDIARLNGFDSFDRARAMQVGYSSRFNSFEWNYNVAERMRKDRMELAPNGKWIRRASPGITWNYLAGLRYFDVAETMAWLAQDIASVEDIPVIPPGSNLNNPNLIFNTRGVNNGAFDGVDADGRMDIATSNDLFGLQLGFGITYESDRWNVTVQSKHGFYVNDARGATQLQFNNADDPTVTGFNRDLHENGVSYLTQGSVTARYHLRPNLSLRAGWEFMYVTGLALAPNQADFNPALAQLYLSGDAFYHGVTCGTEYYW